MSHSTRSCSEQARKGLENDQNEERKRDCAWSHVIKTVTLNQPTTYSTIVLKTGYRQTDRQTHRQTKAFFTVWQTLAFQSRENWWNNNVRVFHSIIKRRANQTSNVHRLPIHSSLDWSLKFNSTSTSRWTFFPFKIKKGFQLSDDVIWHPSSNFSVWLGNRLGAVEATWPCLWNNLKTVKHLSLIDIKSAIHQEMDWSLRTVFSTDREEVKCNES